MKKRILSAILSLALLIGMVPSGTLTVAVADKNLSANDVEGKEYISDSNTIDSWKSQFALNSTEYAGAVWTDKTVLTANSSSLNPGTANLGEASEASVEFHNTYKGTEYVPEKSVDDDDTRTEVPNTGDMSNTSLYLGIMALSALFIAIILVYRKRGITRLKAKHNNLW